MPGWECIAADRAYGLFFQAAQTRGGIVRRVILQEGFLGKEDVFATFSQCFNDNIALAGKLASVQSSLRRIIARNRLEADGLLQVLVERIAERMKQSDSDSDSGSGSSLGSDDS